MKRVVVLLTCVALMLGGCRAAAPATGKVGQTLEYRGFQLTVTSVQEADDFPGARKARSGYKLVAVELKIENPGGRSGAHFDPEHVRLVERSSGDVHKSRSGGREPMIQTQYDLPKGQTLTGWLTFEVGDRVRALTFDYELPSAFDNVLLKVDLDR